MPGLVMGNLSNDAAQFVTASATTISQRKRFEKLIAVGAFSHVFYDEADASAAPKNKLLTQWLAEANPDTKFLGMTATPYARGLKEIWGKVVYEVKLEDAIYTLKVLCPPEGLKCPLDVAIASARQKNGDYDDGKLNELLNHDNIHEAVLAKWLEVRGFERPSLMFCAGIEQARSLALYFTKAGYLSQFIYAGTPIGEREAIKADLCSGKIKMVANVGVWTRGEDIPPVSFLGIVRPIVSPTLHEQIVGRGLRLSPGKNDCLIIYYLPRDGVKLQTIDNLLPERPKTPREKEEEAKQKTLLPLEVSPTAPLQIDYSKLPLSEIDLFGGRSSFAWHKDGALMTASVGKEMAIAIILAELDRVGIGEQQKITKSEKWNEKHEAKLQRLRSYTAYFINGKVENLGSYSSLQEAKRAAEGVAKEHDSDFTVTPSASWRKEYPSRAMVNYAQTLGIQTTPEMKKGDLSQRITQESRKDEQLKHKRREAGSQSRRCQSGRYHQI